MLLKKDKKTISTYDPNTGKALPPILSVSK